jgi:group I intron endonuclease
MTDISVYTITHRMTQKFYLGYSKDTEKRFRNHKSLLRRGIHHCTYLQRAWNLSGEESFDFRRFVACESVADAIEKEQEFLDAFYCDGRLYNSVGTNDLATAMKKAHTRKAIMASAESRRDSVLFKASTAKNRALALTPEAQRKRVETTRKNDSWCAAQRVCVRLINELTGEMLILRSVKDAALFVGASTGNVSACCQGNRNRVKGHLLSYAD